VYNRRIVDVDDEVPVDDDGRLLNELTYLALPIELQGRILYFEITGTSADGEPLQQELDEFDFRALPDSLQGEIRYFRKLVGTGGEFAFGRDGAPLTQTAYGRLPRAERGSIQASGQLVRIGFRAKVLLNGSTLDVAIRDSEGDAVWQLVDAGDATSIHPGGDLSIAVPFNRKVLRLVGVDPPAFSPNGDGINDEAEIRFSVANVNVSRQIEVRIYDLSGRLMWREERMSFGDQTFRWPGTDNDGNHVPPGLYLCRVDVDVDSQGASKQSDHRIIAVAY
jgi:hypothetical protein